MRASVVVGGFASLNASLHFLSTACGSEPWLQACPLGVRLSWVARRAPGLEVTLRDVEVYAADPAALHSDEDFARHRLRKRKFGELERVIIDRPWADNSPRFHRAAERFVSGFRVGPLIRVR